MFQIVREKHSLAYTASSNYLRHKNCIFIRAGIEIDNYEKTLNLIYEQIEDMKNDLKDIPEIDFNNLNHKISIFLSYEDDTDDLK